MTPQPHQALISEPSDADRELDRLRDNLKLTPTERLIRLEKMVNQLIQLRQGMRAPAHE